jgi:hypothetical protein
MRISAMTEETIFATALELHTPGERAAFLDEACDGDAGLRQRVEALLGAHDRAANFMERPAVEQIAAVPPPVQRPDPTATQAESLDFLQPPDKPGSLGRLGHYDVQGIIGHGGMGVVLKAFDEKLHRVVAIKMMAVTLAANATARLRFIREARAAAAICQEHVVTIHAVEADHRPPYLVMQFVEGLSLQEKLDRTGPLGVKEILRIGIQTAEGLAAAYQQGLVHRDVKPANILLENGVERVKITDFGLARVADDARLTQSGVIAGTPEYMSPEQADSQTVDHRSDLFSLGSVLYACCTGRSPFRASSTAAALRRVCDDTPRAIREISPEIPEWLCDVIGKLHAKHPADRFQSAAEVADILGRHLAHLQQPSQVPLPPPIMQPQTVEAVTPSGTRAKHSRVTLAVAAVLVLLFLAICVAPLVVVGGTLFMFLGSRREAADPGPEAHVTESHDTPGVEMTHPSPEKGAPSLMGEAFVIPARTGNREGQFATLADAVAGAQAGDVIEIRGNGPFVSGPIAIDKALTIRAAEGFRPILLLNSGARPLPQPLFKATGPLVLEGLDLEIPDGPPFRAENKNNELVLVHVEGASFHALNCRFGIKRQDGTPYVLCCVATYGASTVEIRNCTRLTSGDFLSLRRPPAKARVTVENCLIAGDGGGILAGNVQDWADVRIAVRHSSFSTTGYLPFHLAFSPKPEILNRQTAAGQVELSANVVVGAPLLCTQEVDKEAKPLTALEVENQLGRLVTFREVQNLYAVQPPDAFLWLQINYAAGKPGNFQTLADWERFWGLKDTGSIQSQVRFKKDIPRSYKGDPIPDDFRLANDSPGKAAGKGGKDLGADMELVGPGAAYERFKETPVYQQWLKDSGQVR